MSCLTSCQTTQDLGFSEIRKYQESLKTSQNSLVPSPPCQILLTLAKSLEKQVLNFSHGVLFHMKTRVSLKYFVNDCLWKQMFASNWYQTLSNLIYLTILVNLRPFTHFYPKIRTLKLLKMLKFALCWNSFFNLFTEVKIWYYNTFQVLLQGVGFQPKYDCFLQLELPIKT